MIYDWNYHKRVQCSKEKNPPFESLKYLGGDMIAGKNKSNIFGCELEARKLISILLKFHKPNTLLFGVPGAGKTTVVKKFAQLIKNKEVPEKLRDAKVYRIKSDVIHDAYGNYIEAYKENAVNLFNDAKKHPDIILFIDKLRKRDDINGEIVNAMFRKNLRLICDTTLEDYHSCYKNDSDFQANFSYLHIKEPDAEKTKKIPAGRKPQLEDHYGITIPDGTIDQAIKFGEEFLPGRPFPEKAIHLLDEACSKAVTGKKNKLSHIDIKNAAAELIGAGFFEESDKDSSQSHFQPSKSPTACM